MGSAAGTETAVMGPGIQTAGTQAAPLGSAAGTETAVMGSGTETALLGAAPRTETAPEQQLAE